MRGGLSDDRTSLSLTIAAGVVSAVILGSESHGTRYRIFLPLSPPPTTLLSADFWLQLLGGCDSRHRLEEFCISYLRQSPASARVSMEMQA
jgi:hypothetical protein